MKAESSIWFRTILMAAITLMALILQAIGTFGLVNGKIGDRDPLKQWIGYWATACSIAFSVTMYFLGRWFTKDIYWQWRSVSETWAATPSLFSVRLTTDLGGVTGVAMGVSMTIVALVSFILNIWLTSMTEVTPYTFLSSPTPQNLSGIGGYNMDDGSLSGLFITGGAGFNELVVQMTMGYLGQSQLSFYNGRYFWVPVFLPEQPSTLLLQNLTTFSLNLTCTQLDSTDFKVVEASRGLNITVPCTEFTIEPGRAMLNSWRMCRSSKAGSYDPSPTTYIVQANSRHYLGPPSWSQYARLYAIKCVTVIESWTVDAYISSYNTTRGQIVNAVQSNSRGNLPYSLISQIFDGLSHFSMTTSDNGSANGIRSPLWWYLVGWIQTSNTTDIGPWVANRLRTVLTSIIDSRFMSSNFTLTGQLLQESSIIRVNKVAVLAGILVQALLVVVIIGLYLCHCTGEYHADDLDLLLERHSNNNPNSTYKLVEIPSSSQVMLTDSPLSSRYKLENSGRTWL
ncbi:hypothetical protein F5H01DRAFT_369311 [Linnemannia elongata]|nr:hypothetical protein F5H01DRAFT_369311 [Linnemannia elongata]